MNRINGERGRWMVIYQTFIGARGMRFSSLSRARRFARNRNGVIRRFRTRDYEVVEGSAIAEIQRARMAHLVQMAKTSDAVFRIAKHFVDHGTLLGAF